MTASLLLEGKLIALLTSICVAVLLTAYAVRVSRAGRIATARLETVRGTVLLGRYPIEAFHWAARAFGKVLSRTGVSPDFLTFLSLGLTLFTMPLAATGRFEAAGVMLILGSSFDALDGIVARELGRTSDAGEAWIRSSIVIPIWSCWRGSVFSIVNRRPAWRSYSSRCWDR